LSFFAFFWLLLFGFYLFLSFLFCIVFFFLFWKLAQARQIGGEKRQTKTKEDKKKGFSIYFLDWKIHKISRDFKDRENWVIGPV
jgi:hypothetical protein